MPFRIFVAEDDANINEVVTEYLKESGFYVTPVFDGKKAAEMISAWPAIDMFILDIMLPGMSGIDLLKLIRAEKRYDKAPVMMLTAMADEYMQLLSFDGLADDYVTKPFSPKVLVKRAQSLLRRAGAGAKVLRSGGVSIDAESYEAYEDGEKVGLTLREFELLKALLENPNRALSRQQLLNMVWGYDFFGDERIVDVHIKNLRKKFKANVIATVKGVGYKAGPGGGGDAQKGRLDV